jgi:hypothetical protein
VYELIIGKGRTIFSKKQQPERIFMTQAQAVS